MNIKKIIENKEILLMALGFREDKKIIIKKANIEKTRCLLKKIYDSFKENDNTIPINKRIKINIKLILSILFHQIDKLK